MRARFASPTTLALIVLVSACAREPNRQAGPPAVISLEDQACVSAPVLTDERVLALLPEKSVALHFDVGTPCVQNAAGARSTYAVVRLPASDLPYLIGVSSMVRGMNVFSPHAMILDAQGKLLREKRRDDFMFQGLTLYAGLRAYPGDAYLVIASDPTPVGQQEVQLQGGMRTMMIPTGVSAFPVNTGDEQNRAFVYAHSGVVSVTHRPMPTTNQPPFNSDAPRR